MMHAGAIGGQRVKARGNQMLQAGSKIVQDSRGFHPPKAYHNVQLRELACAWVHECDEDDGVPPPLC